jgi:hypothetical protein
MNRLTRPLWVILALLFLLEAWLWDHLKLVVVRVVGVIPWGWVRPALTGLIARLSPQATLVVFVIPFIVLLPLKFLEFWFLAHREWLAAVVVLVMAKLVGLGVTAFIFDVTKDKLLQMAWFRRLYEFFVWARDWAHEKVTPITRQIREWSDETMRPIVRRLRIWQRLLRQRRTSRFVERLLRIRRRMRAPAAS